jgi:hypothetical protein
MRGAMTPETGVYEQALRRVYRVMPYLAAAGAVAAVVWSGWLGGLAFLLGAAAAYFNFSRLEQLVASVGPESRRVSTRVYVFFLFRFVLLVGGGYVIVKVFGMNGIAAVAGLFVPLAAIIFEALYELIHGT